MVGAFDEILLNHDDGDITVEHGILSLDADIAGHINFLSSALPAFNTGKAGGKQLLVSHEAHRILAGKMPKSAFLPCTYFRPISLGHLQVELLPSGHSPGSSFLRVEKKNDSLLYASHWSNRPTTMLRRAAFRPANTLLLKLHKDPSALFATSARREQERLGEFCGKLLRAGERVIVVADSAGTAHHIVGLLTELRLPVALDKHLQILMETESELHPSVAAIQVGSTTSQPPSGRWNQGARTQWVDPQSTQPAVLILSKDHLLARRQRSLPQGIWVWTGLDAHLISQCAWLAHLTFAEHFAIQFAPDLSEVEELVRDTQPRHVLVCGEGAQTCVHHLTRRGIDAQVFAPPRLETLF
ncbi:MAG: hypothetical protein FJY29_06525 [Betaproteobacteria bacterium]|nr:hypothetical protein [Betaproteobacteria bacterium]